MKLSFKYGTLQVRNVFVQLPALTTKEHMESSSSTMSPASLRFARLNNFGSERYIRFTQVEKFAESNVVLAIVGNKSDQK